MRKDTFLEIAFNYTLAEFQNLIGLIPQDEKIIIEAGTPLIKREGISVIRHMKQHWPGKILADLKVIDGAKAEVEMAAGAGANLVTASGAASFESLKLFVEACRSVGVKSVIDMLGVPNPMKTLWKANITPDAVFIHRGRDEENSFGKVIQYKDIAKIKGKWDILVGAAGGIDKKELQSAIFNGADIVVVNIVRPGDPWKGIAVDAQFSRKVTEFLQFVH